MRITIESYRIYMLCVLALFIANALSLFLDFGVLKGWLFIALFISALPSAILALSAIKTKEVTVYWKKGKKNLRIPFQESKGGFIAFDEDDNPYRIKLFSVKPEYNKGFYD